LLHHEVTVGDCTEKAVSETIGNDDIQSLIVGIILDKAKVLHRIVWNGTVCLKPIISFPYELKFKAI